MLPIPVNLPVERTGIPPSSERTRAEEEQELRRQEALKAHKPKPAFIDHLNQELPPGWAAPVEYMAPLAAAVPTMPVVVESLLSGVAPWVRNWLDRAIEAPSAAAGMPVVIPVAQMPMLAAADVLAAAEHGAPVSVMQLPDLVLAQLHQQMRAGQPVTQLEVALRPDHLGPVLLTVTMTQERVAVSLEAASRGAKELLEASLKDIGAILVAHQLAPGELKVSLASKGKQMSSGSHGGDSSAESDALPAIARWGTRKRAAKDDDALSVAV